MANFDFSRKLPTLATHKFTQAYSQILEGVYILAELMSSATSGRLPITIIVVVLGHVHMLRFIVNGSTDFEKVFIFGESVVQWRHFPPFICKPLNIRPLHAKTGLKWICRRLRIT